jgi:hypothetical protein
LNNSTVNTVCKYEWLREGAFPSSKESAATGVQVVRIAWLSVLNLPGFRNLEGLA